MGGMNDPLSELVTLRELAKRLGLSVAWLRAEVNAGRVPHLKAGKRLLFSVVAVRRHLIQRASEGVDDDR